MSYLFAILLIGAAAVAGTQLVTALNPLAPLCALTTGMAVVLWWLIAADGDTAPKEHRSHTRAA